MSIRPSTLLTVQPVTTVRQAQSLILSLPVLRVHTTTTQGRGMRRAVRCVHRDTTVRAWPMWSLTDCVWRDSTAGAELRGAVHLLEENLSTMAMLHTSEWLLQNVYLQFSKTLNEHIFAPAMGRYTCNS